MHLLPTTADTPAPSVTTADSTSSVAAAGSIPPRAPTPTTPPVITTTVPSRLVSRRSPSPSPSLSPQLRTRSLTSPAASFSFPSKSAAAAAAAAVPPTKVAFGGSTKSTASRLSLDGNKKVLSASRAAVAGKPLTAKSTAAVAPPVVTTTTTVAAGRPPIALKRRGTAPARGTKGVVPIAPSPISPPLKLPAVMKATKSSVTSPPLPPPPPPPPLIFESRFESGNLHRVVQVSDTSYDLVLSTDVNSHGHTQWFFFQVQGGVPGVQYQLNMLNLEKHHSTFNTGMKPVIYSHRMAEKEGIGWHRACQVEEVAYFRNYHARPYEDASSRSKVDTLQQSREEEGAPDADEDEDDGASEVAASPSAEASSKSPPVVDASEDVTVKKKSSSRPVSRRTIIIKRRGTKSPYPSSSPSESPIPSQPPSRAMSPAPRPNPTMRPMVHSPPPVPSSRPLTVRADSSESLSDASAVGDQEESKLVTEAAPSPLASPAITLPEITSDLESLLLNSTSPPAESPPVSAAVERIRPVSSPLAASRTSVSFAIPSAAMPRATTAAAGAHSGLIEIDMSSAPKKKVLKKRLSSKSKSARAKSAGEAATKKKKKVVKKGKKGAETFYTLSFSFKFPYADDTILLAYHFPFTYSFQRECLAALHASSSLAASCMRRQKLTLTRGGNLCELVTITDFARTRAELEAVKRRKIVVLSARIHPGESNASWIMKGLLEFLVGPSEAAAWLRQNIVFKVVPMLNCDGVVEGCYRTGLSGVDLNRHWDEPSPIIHPTIYHTRKLLLAISVQRPILLFCDFHGHSVMKNSCLYGCDLGKSEGALAPLPIAEHLHFAHIREALTVVAASTTSAPSVGGSAASAAALLRARPGDSSDGVFAAALARHSAAAAGTNNPASEIVTPPPNPLLSLPASISASARAVLAAPLLLEVRSAHVLPELLARRADVGGRFFNLAACAFHVRKEKAGTARVAFWRALRTSDVFTFEASFAGGTIGDLKGVHFQPTTYEEMGARFADTIRELSQVRREKAEDTQRRMWDENNKPSEDQTTATASAGDM